MNPFIKAVVGAIAKTIILDTLKSAAARRRRRTDRDGHIYNRRGAVVGYNREYASGYEAAFGLGPRDN